jgi:hypothetical protein
LVIVSGGAIQEGAGGAEGPQEKRGVERREIAPLDRYPDGLPDLGVGVADENVLELDLGAQGRRDQQKQQKLRPSPEKVISGGKDLGKMNFF